MLVNYSIYIYIYKAFPQQVWAVTAPGYPASPSGVNWVPMFAQATISYRYRYEYKHINMNIHVNTSTYTYNVKMGPRDGAGCMTYCNRTCIYM